MGEPDVPSFSLGKTCLLWAIRELTSPGWPGAPGLHLLSDCAIQAAVSARGQGVKPEMDTCCSAWP